MKYIALFRGINVGGNRKVEMKKLKVLFESLGFTEVSTYINSGNVIFESNQDPKTVFLAITTGLEKNFDFEIPTLVKTEKEMKKIADAIPSDWQNDPTQRTDIAYLFPDVDSKKTIEELPFKKDFVDVRYVKGAIFWNIKKEDVNKSQLAKLISHKLYKSMTIRNINTARFLAGEKK
ncbi:DUF1697 domain-containing protein [Leptospira vanthielii]|uniref:PF08002 family protein n=1 Tax=Leptospira vanthielii serovar Holland str. Waz Holland = ATCC 700522 TaxID=1218591 RepID=N1WIQ5_9LEPT|nr:DUF1697 domain-containing protein [Leptospira vanthielii]EMY71776.1 PF08002 family protein [Leptospira vanthielii serovar Holland str. Waz Holland = ATCC 700522]